jgi:phosphoesterase RecJ-like protein
MIEKLHNSILEAKYIAVVAHVRPDADTLGSASALYSYCLQLHKKVVFVCATPVIEKKYSCIAWVEKIKKNIPASVDLAITCDCASLERIGIDLSSKIINIDHHKSNEHYGDINIIDPDAISTTKVVYDLFEKLHVKVNAKMATALYAGLVEDSNCFSSTAVDGIVFAFAQTLMQLGANHQEVMKYLQNYSTLSHQRLLGKMLVSMELVSNATLAVHKVPYALLEATGASYQDCEEALEKSLDLPTVEISLLIVQKQDGSFKVSLRSTNVDVDLIASSFGGGGHSFRAGCVFDATHTMDTIYEKIIKKVKEIEKKK